MLVCQDCIVNDVNFDTPHTVSMRLKKSSVGSTQWKCDVDVRKPISLGPPSTSHVSVALDEGTSRRAAGLPQVSLVKPLTGSSAV
mmetsp:Transcript_44213/g.117127  ORF Transcript_44213/g.117127 Transcript_44213/m.117127 type:complete len:85 (-) Transcript_44213:76-330(-)